MYLFFCIHLFRVPTNLLSYHLPVPVFMFMLHRLAITTLSKLALTLTNESLPEKSRHPPGSKSRLPPNTPKGTQTLQKENSIKAFLAS